MINVRDISSDCIIQRAEDETLRCITIDVLNIKARKRALTISALFSNARSNSIHISDRTIARPSRRFLESGKVWIWRVNFGDNKGERKIVRNAGRLWPLVGKQRAHCAMRSL